MTHIKAGSKAFYLVRVAESAVLTAILILLAAEPAAADNCDIFISALDCQNTGWTIGIIATAGGAAAAAIAAASRGATKPKVDKKEFKNCNQAANWINSGEEKGSADTGFTSQLGKPTRVGNAQSGYKTSVDFTWKFDPRTTATVLQVPWWPNMSEADKAAVQDYRNALLAHENGHHEAAKDFMAKYGRAITGEGNTPKEAAADLQRKIEEYVAESKERLDEVSKSYDGITHGGRNQSAVGGRDVQLNCPPGIS